MTEDDETRIAPNEASSRVLSLEEAKTVTNSKRHSSSSFISFQVNVPSSQELYYIGNNHDLPPRLLPYGKSIDASFQKKTYIQEKVNAAVDGLGSQDISQEPSSHDLVECLIMVGNLICKIGQKAARFLALPKLSGNKVQAQDVVKEQRRTLTDHGDFHSPDIIAALSIGELDKMRTTRLKDGFLALLRPR